MDDKHLKIVKGRVHYSNPPYLPEIPGGPVILEFKDMKPVELVMQPPLQLDKKGKATNVRPWPGLGLDSVELILGTKLRIMREYPVGEEWKAFYEFRMLRGSPSLVPTAPSKWAAYYAGME